MIADDETAAEPGPTSAPGQEADSPTERYRTAKTAFDALLERDFPDFTVEQYADEKAAAEGIHRERLAGRLWAEARAVPNRLDLTGDGRIGLDDAGAAAKLAGERIGKSWQKAKEAMRGVDADTFRAGRHTMAKLGRTASGVQGFQDRREAKEIKQVCEDCASAAEELTETRRVELKSRIDDFGALRLEALHETLGEFLRIMEALKQHNRVKEYELLDGIGIDTRAIESMGTLDMTVSQSLRNTAATGALGAVAVMGTPYLVTSAVAAAATASTGTAISSLSGAAASNAVLAWLGGGSLAAGGGGMAAGTAVLTGITAGATAGVTLLAAGILVSTHYARKLTEARTYEEDVALAVAGLESAWLVMDGIVRRVDELSGVTKELRDRLVPLLARLDGLVPSFDPSDASHAAVFNQCGLLIKTMVELAQTPLLGDDGELTEESLTVTVKVKNILNTEV